MPNGHLASSRASGCRELWLRGAATGRARGRVNSARGRASSRVAAVDAAKASGESAHPHAVAKLGGSSQVQEFAVKVTSIYRREDDGWKLIHRHADPRVTRKPAESVLES